jgi:hypothetical protein
MPAMSQLYDTSGIFLNLFDRRATNYDSVRTGQKVIAIGAIIGIVIGIVGAIIFCIGICVVYSRTKKRRRMIDAEKNKVYGAGMTNGTGVTTSHPTAVPAPQYQYGPGYGKPYNQPDYNGNNQPFHGLSTMTPAHTADHRQTGTTPS